MDRKLRVQVIQPIIAHYHKSFFESLVQHELLDISIYASWKLPGPEAQESIILKGNNISLNHNCKSFLGNRLFWQKNLKLDNELTAGDVLVVCGNPRFLSNYPLIWIAKREGMGILWWGHGWTAYANKVTASMRRIIMKCADAVLLYTDQEVLQYIKYGFPKEKLFSINNAIDQKPIKEVSLKWDENLLERFKISNNLIGKKILLTCGRITSKMHLELALDALCQITQKDKNYLLVVIGDGEEKKHLIRYSEIIGIKEHVVWLGAIYDQDKLAPWFLSAACFIYPGAIGLSLLHSFGYGLPVITHDNLLHQMPEIAVLENGKNGLMYREGSRRDLADKIIYLTNENNIRYQMSQAAFSIVNKYYTVENMVQRFIDAVSFVSCIKK